ncbi:putative Calcium-binding protein [Blattamonas nauphoetae]|uniref:Calcium-binding protein n=1 Tax=Blattamonas nauphoetae TaxID=2049346 RepID=A0ABQ9Y056_9EUKA|nr:putative Calcium-binding protein [Blattamonas nauphoetae]
MFGRRKRINPVEVIKSFEQNLKKVNEKKDTRTVESALKEIKEQIAVLKTLLYGDPETPVQPENVEIITKEVAETQIIAHMIHHLGLFDFETRKNCTLVFSALVHQAAPENPVCQYLLSHTELVVDLLLGCSNPDLALQYGSMFRECLRILDIAKFVLYSPHFYKLFDYNQLENFELASDAFLSLKDILTRHKPLVAEFLQANHRPFFAKYKELLVSQNYATRRQSVKLLGELLYERSNYYTMTTYIDDPQNLKTIMNLLRDEAKTIQFEAFHVFKIFVVNPNKPDKIKAILLNNKEKLISYLTNFHNERADDEQFVQEKQLLLKEIGKL